MPRAWHLAGRCAQQAPSAQRASALARCREKLQEPACHGSRATDHDRTIGLSIGERSAPPEHLAQRRNRPFYPCIGLFGDSTSDRQGPVSHPRYERVTVDHDSHCVVESNRASRVEDGGQCDAERVDAQVVCYPFESLAASPTTEGVKHGFEVVPPLGELLDLAFGRRWEWDLTQDSRLLKLPETLRQDVSRDAG